MQRMDLKDRWVLVTGASSGLGREMARQLAVEHRARPILVARRADRLQALADELQQRAGIESLVLTADLSRLDDVDRVFREATAERDVYAAVLNAGITHFGNHLAQDWSRFETMMATNVTTNVRLVRHFVPYLLEQNSGGGIMLVSSLQGFVPTPYQSAYSGTKAFLTSYGQALFHEHRGDNLSITTFCPGGIDTEMSAAHGFKERLGMMGALQLQGAESCAREALRAMRDRRYLAVPGTLNRAQMLLTRLSPRKLAGAVLAGVYRKALPPD